MSYGLDFTEVRYETDHAGNRLKATIPFSMFSALTEFWVAARRAQTAKIEATTRPGQYKGSLRAAQTPTPDEAAASPAPISRPAPTHPTDRKWNALLASMPAEEPSAAEPTVISPPPTPTAAPVDPVSETAGTPSRTQIRRSVFYREFIESPPAEVMARIEGGTYFIRAWREHRGLTRADAADLFGRDKTTIMWHEYGRNAPTPATLEKFAQIYDCPLDQITPKPGSDDSPFERAAKPEAEAKAEPKARTISEPRSPADTDYPEAVLAHLLTGKSPMLAWRLYRGLTLKALADSYGGREGNIKQMEANAWLRRSSIDKLCPIFHCNPAQLLRPEGMPSTREALHELSSVLAAADEPAAPNAEPKVRKQQVVSEPAPSAMEDAFMQARKLEPSKSKERTRTRNGRLARMQAELARL
jgi:transcriptional regulator with XRE-family HTH domain